ncbi:MAG: ComEC family competence protein [Bacteroidetes bacterium]|nr:ComEC family competence protein [Bacteroidota bacterium]
MNIPIEIAMLPLISGILVLLYLMVTLFFAGKIIYRFRWVQGFFINCILLTLGYQLTLENTPMFNPHNIIHQDSLSAVLVQVAEPVIEKEKSYKIIVNALGGEKENRFVKADGKLMLYFEKDGKVKDLHYGDRLMINATLQAVKPPTNPGEFNYKRYLANRGIYMQAFVRSGYWTRIDQNKGNVFKRTGIKLREQFLRILRKNDMTGKEYAVASAILLGYDEHLDADQKRQFSGAGAMHILCVSGLHVGIVYVILNSLLGFLNRKKIWRFVKVILLLLSIWFYALITGFSPSVMRAATMFSFIIIGSSLHRKSNIYNSLAASAFLLMVIDPYIITAVGFQLSYMAVLGIVTLFRPVYNLYIPGNWLMDQIWSLTVVSLTATIATFPLSIFYFHQFPNLFLLTNLIAIPASMLILYSGMLVLITSFIPAVSGIIAQFLIWIIRFLNFSVGWIDSLPMAVSKNLYITFPELILFIGFIVCLVIFWIVRKKTFAISGLAILFAMMIVFTTRKYHQLNQENIIVFNVRNHTAIGFLSGRNELLLADSSLLADDRKVNFHIQSQWIEAGISNPGFHDLHEDCVRVPWIIKKGDFMQFKNLKILLFDSETIIYPVRDKIQTDVVILSENPDIYMDDLTELIQFKTLIIDSSNAPWNVKRWTEACLKLGIKYHDVSTMGAWMAIK